MNRDPKKGKPVTAEELNPYAAPKQPAKPLLKLNSRHMAALMGVRPTE